MVVSVKKVAVCLCDQHPLQNIYLYKVILIAVEAYIKENAKHANLLTCNAVLPNLGGTDDYASIPWQAKNTTAVEMTCICCSSICGHTYGSSLIA